MFVLERMLLGCLYHFPKKGVETSELIFLPRQISDVTLIEAGNVVFIPGHFQILSLSGTCKPIKIKGGKGRHKKPV